MSKCRGQYSIQKEINSLIKDQSLDWAKKIQDTNYREQVRQKLLEATPDWCDYRANKCFCE